MRCSIAVQKINSPTLFVLCGSEYGQHTYKPFVSSKWNGIGMFSIHIKMALKY